MRVDIWSDLVCPWCYIGKRRFERALERFPHRDRVQVVYRSFELDPSAPRGHTEDTAARLASKYGMPVAEAKAMMAHVVQTAAGEGLEYQLEGTRSGNTADAHRVVHLAKARGRQDAVIERLYRAYFSDGRSLFDADSLVALAAEAGLDGDEVRDVLESDRYADDKEQDEAAAGAYGVRGVPFVVIDERIGVSGAQPAELFEKALEQAWNDRSSVDQADVEGAVCRDESCS